MLQDKVKYKVENLKLNLLEEEDEENQISDKNDFEFDNGNLQIDESKQNEEKKDEEKKEEKKDDLDDWELLDGEDTVSVNLNDNKYQDDILNEYEIIDTYDEKDEKVEVSKKVEV